MLVGVVASERGRPGAFEKIGGIAGEAWPLVAYDRQQPPAGERRHADVTAPFPEDRTLGLGSAPVSRTDGISDVDFDFNSSNEEITSKLLQSHLQIGIGIPQYLCREIHQSPTFSTPFSYLSLTHFGNQETCFLFSSSNFCLRGSIFKNHCSVALKISGVLQRQQCGYE